GEAHLALATGSNATANRLEFHADGLRSRQQSLSQRDFRAASNGLQLGDKVLSAVGHGAIQRSIGLWRHFAETLHSSQRWPAGRAWAPNPTARESDLRGTIRNEGLRATPIECASTRAKICVWPSARGHPRMPG